MKQLLEPMRALVAFLQLKLNCTGQINHIYETREKTDENCQPVYVEAVSLINKFGTEDSTVDSR